MTLSIKQLAFVNEYLVDFNATQAAIRSGYSPDTARQQGSRLLSNVDISTAIREKVMSADEVLLRLSDIARGDISDLLEITPLGFTLNLMIDEKGEKIVNPKTKLIKKIKQKTTIFLSKNESDEDREVIETEFELYSAHEALRDLGRYHKLFTDKTELTGFNNGPIQVRRVEVVLPPEDNPGDSTT